MATADTVIRPAGEVLSFRWHGEKGLSIFTDRHNRRQPFTRWMKRLANLKNPTSDATVVGTDKRTNYSPHSKGKKSNGSKNNPYPISGKPNNTPIDTGGNARPSFCTPPSGHSVSYASLSQSKTSIPVSHDDQQAPTIGNRSMAPTMSTNPETVHSEAAHSKAGTSATAGGAVSSNGVGGGEGSTFSSPAPSLRSLTTTLTTMQSAAPSNLLAAPNHQAVAAQTGASNVQHGHQNSASAFSHQFPSSPPASAIPAYMTSTHVGSGHPSTYQTATANNLLTDNASVMTLASSSKRRRRNSLDTNASIKALAPSSVFGGSRESLPLSVLSATINDQSSTTGQHQGRQVSIGLANAERASVYSSSGINPAAERNSYYANKTANTGDGVSVRSGFLGHARNDSLTRSIGGLAGVDSPLVSPREFPPQQGTLSRRHSGPSEVLEGREEHDGVDKESIKKTRLE